MVAALPNIVFSHLDSDLPLYFWWQGNFREPLDKKLWGWVDRLIFDSSEWESPAEQFSLVQKIRTLTEIRTILCDLNWTRLVGARFALAQLFDHSCALARIRKIRRVSISCAWRTTGLLFWAGRLNSAGNYSRGTKASSPSPVSASTSKFRRPPAP
jgi:glucose-6-phosphate dehydrogenase assembly protein OpcA